MEIQHDEQNGMFYFEREGNKLAKLTYVLQNKQMVIDHTEVDKLLRGQNIGIKLVKAGVDFARNNGLKILPTCSYAKKILEDNEEYNDVLMPAN